MIGVLGGGQLGLMLGLAGNPLGQGFRFLDPSPDAPARRVGELIIAAFDNSAALDEIVSGCDVVTYEFENVPVASARRVAVGVPVYPPPDALEAAQDRLSEKQLFERAGAEVAAYRAVASQQDLDDALAELGAPLVVKTRRGGYDGKGQSVVRADSDADDLFHRLGGAPLIAEQMMRFDRELSIVAVRNRSGEMACYPVVENHHADGILQTTLAPAPGLSTGLQQRAESLATAVMELLDYTGVLTIELFEAAGMLIANEMAPRVHNSGHWTIEGTRASQFENHLRAILGLPLGETHTGDHWAMVNLIGSVPPIERVLKVPGACLHLYGKAPRQGRKLGHVTIGAPSQDALNERLTELQKVVARR